MLWQHIQMFSVLVLVCFYNPKPAETWCSLVHHRHNSLLPRHQINSPCPIKYSPIFLEYSIFKFIVSICGKVCTAVYQQASVGWKPREQKQIPKLEDLYFRWYYIKEASCLNFSNINEALWNEWEIVQRGSNILHLHFLPA